MNPIDFRPTMRGTLGAITDLVRGQPGYRDTEFEVELLDDLVPCGSSEITFLVRAENRKIGQRRLAKVRIDASGPEHNLVFARLYQALRDVATWFPVFRIAKLRPGRGRGAPFRKFGRR